MSIHWNSTSDLMEYFGVADIKEFQEFWFSLHAEEQIYYRRSDLI